MDISRRALFTAVGAASALPLASAAASVERTRIPCRISWFNWARGLGSVELDGGPDLIVRLRGAEEDMRKYLGPRALLELDITPTPPLWALHGVYKDGERLPLEPWSQPPRQLALDGFSTRAPSEFS